MAKGLMDMIIDSIFDDEWVGKRGEKLTERELKLVKLFGRKGRTLRNVYIPKDNGETSEIDVVYITQKGIFVFESKNYSGWIFGDEKGQYWTAMLPNRQKNRFYNPIKQNKTHIKWLQKYVGDNIPLFSIIVFSERCELKKVEVESTDIKVIKRDQTYAAVRDIWDRHEDAVNDVDAIYEKLKPLTNVDAAVKAAHIADIEKSKYLVKASKSLLVSHSVSISCSVLPTIFIKHCQAKSACTSNLLPLRMNLPSGVIKAFPQDSKLLLNISGNSFSISSKVNGKSSSVGV